MAKTALQKSSGALQRLPKDKSFGPTKVVGLMAVGGLVMGPGCGALAGSLYGDPIRGLFFGAAVLGVSCLVVLPAVLSRGVRRQF